MIDRIKKDFDNFKWKNESEEIVLASNYFSAYKGKLVFRVNGRRSGSFGILFITKKRNNRDVVRHEYGHAMQLKQLGIIKYLLCIGIPSWKEWKRSMPYYDRPWEVTADILGGVKSRTHSEKQVLEGYRYLEKSQKNGTKIWKNIEKT